MQLSLVLLSCCAGLFVSTSVVALAFACGVVVATMALVFVFVGGGVVVVVARVRNIRHTVSIRTGYESVTKISAAIIHWKYV